MIQFNHYKKTNNGKGKVFFVKLSAHQNYPFFENFLFADMFVHELRKLKKSRSFKLFAFCTFPGQIQLLLETFRNNNINNLIENLKLNFSRSINNLYEGDISLHRLNRFNDGTIMHFKYILNIYSHFKLSSTNVPAFKWNDSQLIHLIKNKEDFKNQYRHIVKNFCRNFEIGFPSKHKNVSYNYLDLIDKPLI